MEVNRPFKIAFVGAGGVGKDTLINEARNTIFPGITSCAFVPEAAEAYFMANPIPEEERFSTKTQGEIQLLQKQFEDEQHANNPQLMICNRSVIDAAVYARTYGDIDGSEMLFGRVLEWDRLQTYSAICILDPEGVPFVRTKIRLEVIEFRDRLHKTFLEFFNEKKIPYHVIRGSVTARMNEVSRIVAMA